MFLRVQCGRYNPFVLSDSHNTFGNCIGFARCLATWDELLGEDGMVVAANVIGSKVKEPDKEISGEAEKWISYYEVFFGSELHVFGCWVTKVGVLL